MDSPREAAEVIREQLLATLHPKEAKEMMEWLLDNIPDDAIESKMNMAGAGTKESGKVIVLIIEVHR